MTQATIDILTAILERAKVSFQKAGQLERQTVEQSVE